MTTTKNNNNKILPNPKQTKQKQTKEQQFQTMTFVKPNLRNTDPAYIRILILHSPEAATSFHSWATQSLREKPRNESLGRTTVHAPSWKCGKAMTQTTQRRKGKCDVYMCILYDTDDASLPVVCVRVWKKEGEQTSIYALTGWNIKRLRAKDNGNESVRFNDEWCSRWRRRFVPNTRTEQQNIALNIEKEKEI